MSIFFGELGEGYFDSVDKYNSYVSYGTNKARNNVIGILDSLAAKNVVKGKIHLFGGMIRRRLRLASRYALSPTLEHGTLIDRDQVIGPNVDLDFHFTEATDCDIVINHLTEREGFTVAKTTKTYFPKTNNGDDKVCMSSVYSIIVSYKHQPVGPPIRIMMDFVTGELSDPDFTVNSLYQPLGTLHGRIHNYGKTTGIQAVRELAAIIDEIEEKTTRIYIMTWSDFSYRMVDDHILYVLYINKLMSRVLKMVKDDWEITNCYLDIRRADQRDDATMPILHCGHEMYLTDSYCFTCVDNVTLLYTCPECRNASATRAFTCM